MPTVSQRAPVSPLHRRFCNNLRALRKSKGWTQEQAAKRCRMTQPQYCEIETGRSPPMLETIERVAKSLGVDPAELFRTLEVAAA